MRPVVRSDKRDASGNPLEYKPWGEAKEELVSEMGMFCSYCEKQVNKSDLHVEHILGQCVKDGAGSLVYDGLKYHWDNFLLACCNCNRIKGVKDVKSTNPFLPHQNNLVHFIEVDHALINIKSEVTGANLDRARAFIDLVGLDRVPGVPGYTVGDDRWANRMETAELAERQYTKYTASPRETDAENIISLAASRGFFSVWYYCFYEQKEVIDALINGLAVYGKRMVPFQGTHAGSFRAPDFSTVERP
jgi:hypothetical protein